MWMKNETKKNINKRRNVTYCCRMVQHTQTCGAVQQEKTMNCVMRQHIKMARKKTRKIRKTKEKERTTLASGLGVVKIKKKI